MTSATSPTLAGYLFDHVALSLPFEIGALLQGFNTLIFYLFFRDIQPPEERGNGQLKQGAQQEAEKPVLRT